jgi:hypothetical protein
MKKQKVLILGNKQYYNFKLDEIVDSFDIIYRFNMTWIGENNGTKFGRLAMCNHVYDSFALSMISKEQAIQKYGNELSAEFILNWYDFFKQNKQNFEEIFYEQINTGNMNSLLKEYGCPHRFSKMASTGYSIIFKNMIKENDVYALGFTLSEQEIRKTQGEHDEFAKSKNLTDAVHSFSEERQILAWLHNNKKIDASLCMLADTEEVTFEKNIYNTQPSEYIINLLEKEKL